MHLAWEQVLTQILAFLIMLAILKKFAWGPILTLLEERRQKIEDSFKQIEQEKEVLQKQEVEYEKKMADSEAAARKVMKELVEKGNQKAEALERETRDHIAKLLQKADSEVKIANKKAKEELKQEIVEMAVLLAEKAIGNHLDEKTQASLVEENLKRS